LIQDKDPNVKISVEKITAVNVVQKAPEKLKPQIFEEIKRDSKELVSS